MQKNDSQTFFLSNGTRFSYQKAGPSSIRTTGLRRARHRRYLKTNSAATKLEFELEAS